MYIQSEGYSRMEFNGFQRKASLDEKFMYMGLGKYQRVLDQKNEFQKLIEKKKDKNEGGEGFCARV